MAKFKVATIGDAVKEDFTFDTAILESSPEVCFRNFKKDSRDYVCHVYECKDGGLLIYLDTVSAEDVFTKLEPSE